jgi:multiple sugar transport system ATP-binding protein
MGDIILEDVWKVFKDRTVALRAVNLVVEPGEFFVVLGPSGSGKTTLLRTVAGLEDITSGRVYIGGKDVTDDSTKARNVAMVFQNFVLYPHMNVYKNIAFGIESRKLKKSEIDQRVRRTAALLGIEDLLKKRPRYLSGGQQQRVSIGRAVVREPTAFLMDEPLSNIDVRLRVELRAEIARIQKELGVTTLYVTHDQSEAMALGDRVAVLRDGHIEQVADPGRLYRRPMNLFVAGFVGSPPMNLAEATVEAAVDGGLFVRFAGFRIPVEGAGPDPDEVRRFAWRPVVLGVRPEDLLDASSTVAPADGRLHVVVERRELIGADVHLYFTVDAPLLLTEDPRDPASDVAPDQSWAIERVNTWMARVGSSDAREGDAIEIAMRPGSMHLFDPRTGDLIGR